MKTYLLAFLSSGNVYSEFLFSSVRGLLLRGGYYSRFTSDQQNSFNNSTVLTDETIELLFTHVTYDHQLWMYRQTSGSCY